MTDREMKKLSRSQLLEMLLTQAQEVKQLRADLELAQIKLESRQIQMTESGNIAEAALKLSGVCEAAQSAADQYLQNISALSERAVENCQKMEEQTRKKCDEMVSTAEKEAAAFWDAIREKIRDPYLENASWQEILQILDTKPGDCSKVRK